MLQIQCVGCGVLFASPARRRKYCSRGCYSKNADWESIFKNRRSYAGTGNPFFGKKVSEENKEKLRKIRLGKKLPKDVVEKIRKAISNEKCYAWKGGVSRSWWQKRVLERDDYTCQVCGLRDEEIVEADHIKSQADFPQLRRDLANGMTLCPNCHRRKSNREAKKRLKRLWKEGRMR